MTTVADLVVRRLVDAGVITLFGMPGGGSNTNLIEAAGRIGLRFVLSHTETGGALMASAQAEITGRPGACLATLGPGTASIVNGAAHAFLDRVPLLLFTDTLNEAGRAIYQHQNIDHRALLSPVTKWSARLSADAPEVVLEQGLQRARLPPPGPVHLDCSADVSASNLAREPRPVEPDCAAVPPDRGRLPQDVITLLRGARRPLAIAGLGGRQAEDVTALRELYRRHSVPTLVTYKAKGVAPDADPLFGGIFTNGALERPVLEAADLLIGVGLDPVELLPRPWSYNRPLIYCGRWSLSQRHLPVIAELVGSIPGSLDAVGEHLVDTTWDTAWLRTMVEGQQAAMRVASDGLAPYQVVETLAGVLPRGIRVTVDAGAHMFPIMALWPACDANQFLISNGLSTMGYALPAAIGAALLDADRPVVALTGDGGLLLCAGELRTAAREGLRIIIVVFNDQALSLIKIKQQQRGYRTDGVTVGDMDWCALGEGMGMAAFSAATAPELERAVAQALGCGGSALIDARIDPSGYGETLRVLRG